MTSSFFFFNDPATTEIYPLSLHDALPIYLVGFTLSPVLWRKLPGARSAGRVQSVALRLVCDRELEIEKFAVADQPQRQDRKSTRLNSSHLGISYAVFCL